MNKKTALPGDVFVEAGLAKPAQRALHNIGIATLTQLAAYKENEIAQLHGIGKNALVQLKKVMNEQGLAFQKD